MLTALQRSYSAAWVVDFCGIMALGNSGLNLIRSGKDVVNRIGDCRNPATYIVRQPLVAVVMIWWICELCQI